MLLVIENFATPICFRKSGLDYSLALLNVSLKKLDSSFFDHEVKLKNLFYFTELFPRVNDLAIIKFSIKSINNQRIKSKTYKKVLAVNIITCLY